MTSTNTSAPTALAGPTTGRISFRITGPLDVVDVALYRLRDAFTTVDVGDVTPLTGTTPMISLTVGVTL